MLQPQSDLIQFAASQVTESRTCAPEIVRCELVNAGAAAGFVRWLDAGGIPANVSPLRGVAYVSSTAAAELFAGASRRFEDAIKTPSEAFPLATTVTLRTVARHSSTQSSNVIGVLRGADPRLRNEYVVYTAHLDHVGIGTPVEGDSIYNGVSDNASGVSTMLAIARAYTLMPLKPRRSIMFLAPTAEEFGLVGSDYFTQNPTVPIDSIAANVNMDGATTFVDFRDVVVVGAEHSTLNRAVMSAADALGLEITPDPTPEEVLFTRSDHYSFVKQGVPALFPSVRSTKAVDPTLNALTEYLSWQAKHYHQPSDDLTQPRNVDAAIKGARFRFLLGYFIANDPERPKWNAGDFFGEMFGKRP